MIKSNIWSEVHDKNRSILFLLASACIAVLTLALINVSSSLIGGFTYAIAIVIGAFLFLIVLALRRYELAVAMIVAVHIYVDWYLGLEIIAPLLAIGLLFLLYFVRASQYPWIPPHAPWLWCLFLVIAVPPTIQAIQIRYDLEYYYPNIIVNALVMFWLGMLIARNRAYLKNFFRLLAALGILLAIHTIIQRVTGTVVFGSTRADAFLTQVSGYTLANSTVSRVGSFFTDPNWNGTFFATILFLLFGLFAESASFLQKLYYFSGMLLIAVALLFTYSVGAWVSALAGFIAFMLFTGRSYYRVLMPGVISTLAGILLVFFPGESNVLFQRAIDPAELALRSSAWQTAINIIKAFPLTGIGLSFTNYLQRSAAYGVQAKYIPLAHPHNSYLELAAMAGLPTLFVFLALLLFALWKSWRNWIQADARTRCLLGGGIASIVALSVNSMSINGWTLPPLAAIGWLVLGAISSPLLFRKQVDESIAARSDDLSKESERELRKQQ